MSVPGMSQIHATSLAGTINAAELSAAEKGRMVFVEADERDSGYVDLTVNLTMILKNARGGSTERSLRIRQFERNDDGDKVLVVFDKPANIRGTALLSHARIDAPDDQWLFLPALKRTKKIASRNQSGPFVGSEFAFEDLSPREVAKFDYSFVEQTECGELTCYVVDRMPIDEYSGYSKQRVWLDVEHLRIQQIDYADRRGRPVKTLKVDQYQLFNDRFWRPAYMRMDNLKTRKSTELYWRDYAFAVGLSEDRDFSVNSLRRVR